MEVFLQAMKEKDLLKKNKVADIYVLLWQAQGIFVKIQSKAVASMRQTETLASVFFFLIRYVPRDRWNVILIFLTVISLSLESFSTRHLKT